MSENKPFVITDRRKFTLDGTPRPDADPSPEKETAEHAPAPVAEAPPTPAAAAPQQSAAVSEPPAPLDAEDTLPPGPTAEESDRSRKAYEATADRLDTAVRAANPGADHMPPMNFERLVQSVYMTAIMQLGGATPEGEQPQVDILGARQSIDMLAVLADKTKGNLNADETRLLDSALFELRMAFLEITQALARSASARAQGQPTQPPTPGRPSIVR
ncbi:DUF1844 domain-containing protein [Edaphobacter bradus]|uniref:DUF1844 domain-containing protein n=1 Tax=Edaphobacter bradus TaxID=2259016 RepID=UPI0021DF81A2|nr:DUF1844 domain-containing protein [Edaphobacter bradus]